MKKIAQKWPVDNRHLEQYAEYQAANEPGIFEDAHGERRFELGAAVQHVKPVAYHEHGKGLCLSLYGGNSVVYAIDEPTQGAQKDYCRHKRDTHQERARHQ